MDNERHENFKRLGTYRTNEVLRRLKVLGNCSNRSHYDYAEEEVNKIFSEIDKKVKEAKARFTFPNKERKFTL
jgi:hypothetical protein